MRELEGKNAIVTGSNRGIGKAVVKKFAENGCSVWACARKYNKEFEEEMKELAEKNNVWIKPVYFDLRNVKDGAKSIFIEKKPIDILINNAGIGHMELFCMTKMSRVQEIFDVNLFAAMELTQMTMRKMIRKKSGKIINISSTAADETYVGNAVYGASKAALNAFTKSLAAESLKYGITVNAIAPGLSDTDMSAVFEGNDPDEPIRRTALGRKIYPEEIANVIIVLLSDKTNIINGEVICANGGHK